MTRRTEDHYGRTPKRPADQQTSGLGLFEQPATINLPSTDSGLIDRLGSYDGPRPTPQPDPRIEWPAPSNARPASENAADALATPQGKVRRASQNVRILRLLAGRESGYTRDELSEATGIPIQTVCARIGHDLIARGYVEESETITRLTRSGKPAAVLFISPKGRAWLLSKQEAA